MPNTFTQIHLQLVFAVKYREAVIHSSWKDELFMYITGIIRNNNHQLLAINGMPDHVHILIGFRPSQSLSDLMQDIKGDSSKWINKNRKTKHRFRWQEGYGAFSYSKSQIESVKKYIENQEDYHSRKSFLKEYKEFLEKFEVEYDERYIFNELE